MKKITLLFITLFYIGICFSQNDIAKVAKVNGIEVYILNEPLRKYEVAFNKKKGIQWSSFLTGGFINASISTKITRYIDRLQKESKETGEKFDAIVYTNGKNVTAIRFIDPNDSENKGLATVQKIEGIPVFAMCEPILAYDETKKKGGGIKWKSMVTVGLWNNSIEQDLIKFAKRFKRHYKKKKIDAIIYRRQKKAYGIKFSGGKNTNEVASIEIEDSTTEEEIEEISTIDNKTKTFTINGNWKSSCGRSFTLVKLEKQLKQFVGDKEFTFEKTEKDGVSAFQTKDGTKSLMINEDGSINYKTTDGFECTWTKE
ncbi:hypothetical protein IMCC3317_12760 [Kordia antarctica]|uniref:Uncharacterized protein n=1 Tax=Kordia antarctica TaxID=1218801 RepID=A0A7L4ZGP6_9FLAO|nr:hypothetical protein [Kordia antarctica]QHI35928.1 hypothetical protein IMCC3317_12760 [Kordia antarctica]